MTAPAEPTPPVDEAPKDADPTVAETEQTPPEKGVEHWQAEARKWEQRAKDNKKALDEAAPRLAEFDKLREAQMTELQREQAEKERWQTEATRMRGAAVASRIQALASDEFADATDAVDALAGEGKFIDAGGQIDDAAIRAELAEVLARKPHWRKATVSGDAPQPPRVPAPNSNQGSGGGGKPSSDPRQEFAALLQSGLNR